MSEKHSCGGLGLPHQPTSPLAPPHWGVAEKIPDPKSWDCVLPSDLGPRWESSSALAPFSLPKQSSCSSHLPGLPLLSLEPCPAQVPHLLQGCLEPKLSRIPIFSLISPALTQQSSGLDMDPGPPGLAGFPIPLTLSLVSFRVCISYFVCSVGNSWCLSEAHLSFQVRSPWSHKRWTKLLEAK